MIVKRMAARERLFRQDAMTRLERMSKGHCEYDKAGTEEVDDAAEREFAMLVINALELVASGRFRFTAAQYLSELSDG